MLCNFAQARLAFPPGAEFAHDFFGSNGWSGQQLRTTILTAIPIWLCVASIPTTRSRLARRGEIKSTRKAGGAVDTHGARQQWMCVFVYEVDNQTEPASEREAMRFTEIYLARVDDRNFLFACGCGMRVANFSIFLKGKFHRLMSGRQPSSCRSS